jgi:hypothetical protein
MEATASASRGVDTRNEVHADAVSTKAIFPFLRLPRELRDSVHTPLPLSRHYWTLSNLTQIYNYALQIEDDRSQRALRIERRNLKYFKPSAAAILLILHHEYFLLNRQVAREALEVLLKNHTVFLSCGPFVLKALLERIEEQNGPGRQWLKWMKKIELDWVTFPNLTHYPPDREAGRDEWYWEQDEQEVDVDYIRGAQYNGHYDEYDHEGGHYDDNFYDPSDATLYPSFQPPPAQPPNANDPFGFASHYPFADPTRNPDDAPSLSREDISTKLDLLVQMEVTPLFTYLASSTFNVSSITIPLYFISRESYHHRNITRPGYALPLKIRYWVQVCVHALSMLHSNKSTLDEVRVRYLPWDIWASMGPADDLSRVAERGVWFDEVNPDERAGEGEAFRAVWSMLREQGYTGRMGLQVHIKYIKWDGNVDAFRVGDELEVVFTKTEAM